MRTILQDGALVIVAGLALGVLAATWLSQLITGMLHDAPPVTAGALLGVGALLAASALLAAYLPTRRATRIAAVEALRQQ
jgi:ABC-type antimicrobial peptide transport system permease subunit